MSRQVENRRKALRSILMGVIVIAGCDFRSRYSENTPAPGANWEWKARAMANPSELMELARTALAATPDAIMYKSGYLDGVINWPRESSKNVLGPNTWQISFSTNSIDSDHSELSMFAKFFGSNAANNSDETPPSLEAKQRLNALIKQMLQAGASLQLSSTVELHPIKTSCGGC